MFEKSRKSLKDSAVILRWLPFAAIVSLSLPVVWAQPGPGFNSTVPSQIMDQFRDQRILWTTNVWVYANSLFGILAIIEFAWSAAVMLLEKSDLQSWTSALVRKLMWIGAFYALLLNGRIWIPAIIDSFTQIGQNAAGLGALSPSGVFIQGLSLGACPSKAPPWTRNSRAQAEAGEIAPGAVGAAIVNGNHSRMPLISTAGRHRAVKRYASGTAAPTRLSRSLFRAARIVETLVPA